METVTYIYLPTKRFAEKLEQIKRYDPPGHERIWTVINRLLANPNEADGKMHGLYHGRFKKYVGRRDYRLIYYWCEICRKENRKQEKSCDDCATIDDRSVIFFDLYHKKDSKKISRLG